MEMTKLKPADYDPFVANELTDGESVAIRRRHALDDAHKTRAIAVNKAFADEAAAIQRIHAHFDAMAKAVKVAA